ncbi:polymer-forming cytoskeletal protein, partial [Brevundimonas sp.]|uniref:bactofilin family protein n=1 Tax=Brevundimonas sp. TaxID=1871086 RepID=UPI0019B095A3
LERALDLEVAAPRSSSLSTLSAGVKYEGNISGAGDLQIEGSLKGDVRVARVVIGEGGSVEGTVHADVLDVRGRVAGAIVAKQVRLYATARVEGDITQEQLSVEQGAWFQGRCNQAKRDTPGASMLEPPVEKKADAKEKAPA